MNGTAIRGMPMLGVACLILLAVPPTPAQQRRQAANPNRAVVKSFRYKQTEQAGLKIHVHFPPGWKADDKRPAIVFFFGGGWKTGSVTQFEKQARYLARRGIVAARADYRVRKRHGVRPDACVEDAKSAVRWLRAKSSRLGVDPNRIVAAGGSSGGHIAACTALTPGLEAQGEDREVSSTPNAMVLFNPVLRVTGAAVGGDEKLAKQISPTLYVTRDTPPALLLYGTKDRLLRQGEEYVKVARKAGCRAEMYRAEGVGHGFFNRSPWMERTNQRVDAFLVSLGYRVERKPEPAAPDLTKQHLDALVITRETLAKAAAPLEEIDRRLETLESAIDDLERHLPRPEDPRWAGQRVAYVHQELESTRHTMFMLGLIDEQSLIAVPANPLDAMSPDDARAWARAMGMLRTARGSIQQMKDTAARVGRQLDAIEAEIRSLERQIPRRSTGARKLSARVDEVQAQANVVAERLSDPWLHQLDVTQRMIAKCREPLDAAEQRLNGLDEQIRAVREMMDSAPRDTPTLVKLRDAFGRICEDLRTTFLRVGTGEEDSIPLPTNPFEGRRLKDRRVLRQMEAELEVAAEAAGMVRALVAGQRSRFDRLTADAVGLGQEIADRLDGGGELDDLRRRFSDLTREILALYSPPAEA